MRWIAIAALPFLLAGCGDSGSGPSTPPAAKMSEAEQQAALAALPAPYNTADLANGRAKFALCRSCHTIVPGGPNMTGPNLHAVFGQKAGAHEGYRYSKAMTASGIVWDAARLDAWLANPRTYLPGTKMSFAGIDSPKDRVDLIAFLKLETGYSALTAKQQP